jgi:hypothetical protein
MKGEEDVQMFNYCVFSLFGIGHFLYGRVRLDPAYGT